MVANRGSRGYICLLSMTFSCKNHISISTEAISLKISAAINFYGVILISSALQIKNGEGDGVSYSYFFLFRLGIKWRRVKIEWMLTSE